MASVDLNALTEVQTPASTDNLLLFNETSNVATRIDYDKLAEAILNKTRSEIGGVSPISAIAALNSSLTHLTLPVINVASNDDLYAIYDTRTNGESFRQRVALASPIGSIQPGVYVLEGYKNSANYWMRLYSYSALYGIITVNVKNNGTWGGWFTEPTRDEISSINFGVNTSAASTEKAVYIKAVADAVAETVGITTNKSILGYVFVSGIDAFSCMGAIRGSTIRMIIVASNASAYSVVRNSDGAVTYKEIAWVS